MLTQLVFALKVGGGVLGAVLLYAVLVVANYSSSAVTRATPREQQGRRRQRQRQRPRRDVGSNQSHQQTPTSREAFYEQQRQLLAERRQQERLRRRRHVRDRLEELNNQWLHSTDDSVSREGSNSEGEAQLLRDGTRGDIDGETSQPSAAAPQASLRGIQKGAPPSMLQRLLSVFRWGSQVPAGREWDQNPYSHRHHQQQQRRRNGPTLEEMWSSIASTPAPALPTEGASTHSPQGHAPTHQHAVADRRSSTHSGSDSDSSEGEGQDEGQGVRSSNRSEADQTFFRDDMQRGVDELEQDEEEKAGISHASTLVYAGSIVRPSHPITTRSRSSPTPHASVPEDHHMRGTAAALCHLEGTPLIGDDIVESMYLPEESMHTEETMGDIEYTTRLHLSDSVPQRFLLTLATLRFYADGREPEAVEKYLTGTVLTQKPSDLALINAHISCASLPQPAPELSGAWSHDDHARSQHPPGSPQSSLSSTENDPRATQQPTAPSASRVGTESTSTTPVPETSERTGLHSTAATSPVRPVCRYLVCNRLEIDDGSALTAYVSAPKSALRKRSGRKNGAAPGDAVSSLGSDSDDNAEGVPVRRGSCRLQRRQSLDMSAAIAAAPDTGVCALDNSSPTLHSNICHIPVALDGRVCMIRKGAIRFLNPIVRIPEGESGAKALRSSALHPPLDPATEAKPPCEPSLRKRKRRSSEPLLSAPPTSDATQRTDGSTSSLRSMRQLFSHHPLRLIRSQQQ